MSKLGRLAVLFGVMITTAAHAAPRLSPQDRAAARAAGLDPTKLLALRGELEALVARGDHAGIVTVIGRRGLVGSAIALGQADRERRRPMRVDTIFRIASMTKVVTAVAVLMLEDAGKLSVDDPVERHLPEFRGQKLVQKREGDTVTLVDPPRPITIKDLLTHTSGMKCTAPGGYTGRLPGEKLDRPLAELVAAISQQPLERAPGSEWKYCGTGFDTLGRVVEVVAKRPLPAFFAERIFRPLGMRDTTFRLSGAQRARLAAVYRKADGPSAALVRNEGLDRPDRVQLVEPGGGLYSTARDYARFAQMLLDGGSAGGRRFLRPETVARMTTVAYAPKTTAAGPEKVGFSSGLGMGLGVQVVMKPEGVTEALTPGSFGHGGAHGTQAWIDPGNDIYFLLMVQRQGFGDGDRAEARQLLQRAGAGAIVKVRTDPKPGLFTSPGAAGAR